MVQCGGFFKGESCTSATRLSIGCVEVSETTHATEILH